MVLAYLPWLFVLFPLIGQLAVSMPQQSDSTGRKIVKSPDLIRFRNRNRGFCRMAEP